MFLNLCLILFTISIKVQAFWWQPTTTETPAISVKHIPLTYFRTYTYQPINGGPFTFPFGFGGTAQTPLLNGGRYEHYTYPGAQHFHNGILGSSLPTSTSTTAPTTSSTTSTTTTTTPPPTTTTSTTTTTTSTSTPPKNIEPMINSGGGTYGPLPHEYDSPMYPTYNRRLYMSNLNGGNYYRPHYPYPDYASITKTAPISQQQPPNVQFVPCMCPISVGVHSGLPIPGSGGININVGDPSNNLYMTQGRSNDVDDDSEMELPLDSDGVDVTKITSIDLNDLASRQTKDKALLSDEIQTLESNNIDSSYRQSKELLISSTVSP